MSGSRRLAAIMFTDIVGYTAMMQADEHKSVAVIKHYNAALETLVSQFQGQVLNYYGDGSLCIFSSATDAANCALAVQNELKNEPKVPLRIGLHIGEVFFEEAKALGDAVNVASRVQSLGKENTILVSGEFYDKIKNNSTITSRSLGHFRFKNVEKSLEVYVLTNEGLFVPKRKMMEGKLKKANFFSNPTRVIALLIIILGTVLFIFIKFRSDSSAATHIGKSIAVLPFADMSPGKDQEYLGDGLAEEIITTLSGLKDIKVIGRTSSFQFKNIKTDLREIGKKLNVGVILEGSVQKFGNKVRITAELIQVKDNTQLWSQQYDRQMEDIFRIQDEIASRITELLKITLSNAENQQLTKKTTSPETYTLYLKGLYAYRGNDFVQSIEYNTEAIKLDPGYALPYAYVALAKAWIIINANDVNNTSAYADALSFAHQAIQLDPGLAEGYSAIALMAWTIEHNFPKARENFEKSIQLNVNSSLIKNRYAYFLTWMADFNKASTLASAAIQSDPVDFNGYFILSMVNQYTGNLKQAKQFIQEGTRLFPENPQFPKLMIYNDFLEGHYPEVIRICDSMMNQHIKLLEPQMAQWSIAYYKTNHIREGNSLFHQLDTLFLGKSDSPNYHCAVIWAYRNQPDSCFSRLEKAIMKPEPYCRLLKIDPAFATLRKRPEYQKLYTAFGFDKY